jgi:two-component system phosphate regulon response regulator PhoB
MKPKLLVVDDEPGAGEILEQRLRDAGFTTIMAADGVRALELAREQKPELILLDIVMPELDGFEVCRLLRRDEATASIPVIFLTARTEEMDRIVGLELGAEDYITKPFSSRELVLRIKRALLRVSQKHTLTVFTFGTLNVDLRRHEVTLEGERVQLTATEFRLLEVLVRDAGYLYSREQLLKAVWNYEAGTESRTVDTHVRRLREKLGVAARHIETVRGEGYRFVQRLS